MQVSYPVDVVVKASFSIASCPFPIDLLVWKVDSTTVFRKAHAWSVVAYDGEWTTRHESEMAPPPQLVLLSVLCT